MPHAISAALTFEDDSQALKMCTHSFLLAHIPPLSLSGVCPSTIAGAIDQPYLPFSLGTTQCSICQRSSSRIGCSDAQLICMCAVTIFSYAWPPVKVKQGSLKAIVPRKGPDK